VVVAAAVAVVGVSAVIVATSATAGSPGVPDDVILPDLDQAVPTDLSVQRRGNRVLLGFGASVENVGPGPLIVEGERPAGRVDMVANQVVRRRNGPMYVKPAVGHLRFTISPDHRHWHYLRAVRYELRRASDHLRVATDRKTGFCLGDRYETRRHVNGTPPERNFDSDCGLEKPGALTLREGISPGWGDSYPAYLEGQSIDVTGLKPGVYILVHRANADGALLETTRANNASSVRFRLTAPSRPGGLPGLRVVARCPNTANCPRPAKSR
jgi:hypothetical protein